MTAPRSLTVTGSLELQLDTLAERVAQRVVELLQPPTGSPIYERAGELPDPRTTDTDPGGFPVGRDHPYSPDNPEETLS